MLKRTLPFRFATRAPTVASNFDRTHAVTNQPKPLNDFDAFLSCPLFTERITQSLEDKKITEGEFELVAKYGQECGTPEAQEHSRLANIHVPSFSRFDRYGHPLVGTVSFHPSYHELMSMAVRSRVPSLPWVSQSPSRWLARGVLSMQHYQLEQGTSCPLTMTCAGVAPLLRHKNAPNATQTEKDEFSLWIDKLTSNEYDPRDIHVSQKKGATIGMSMTEKQSGTYVRENSTVAQRISSTSSSSSSSSSNSGEDSFFYSIRGHKWFTSAPMCDAFLTLAQVEGKGLTCFLIPRWVAPGEPNSGLQFQRLKGEVAALGRSGKLGDHSNASSEVQYHDAIGFRVGPEGRGVKTIIEMVNLTRLDCLIGSGALMHRACLEATHHAHGRNAFGSVLVEKPLMANVLCDLAVESEAAQALGLRMCDAFDNATRSEEEAVFARIGVAISKYFVCKRVPALAYEAMECLGGNGYTEDFVMSRIYRQAPLNAIWEGSGNVIVLDVFRAVAKEPETVVALRKELARLVKNDKRLAAHVGAFDKQMASELSASGFNEANGRVLVERLARLLQASALQRNAGTNEQTQMMYDAFIESRVLNPNGLALFGTLPSKFVSKEIIQRTCWAKMNWQEPTKVKSESRVNKSDAAAAASQKA